MDLRNIDLVAVYENLMEVPESDKTTTYSLQHETYYIKDERSMTKAREVKAKALEFLEICQEEFNNNVRYRNKEKIHSDIVDKMMRYSYMSNAADYKYLLQNMPHNQLRLVERVLEAYCKNKIGLEIPRNQDTQEIDFDGEFKVIINEPYKELGIEKDILKWFESLEDTGYMMDTVAAFKSTIQGEIEERRYNMDRRVFELVAAYEKEMNIPEQERTTMYSDEWKAHTHKGIEFSDKLWEVRDKALNLIGHTLSDFKSNEAFADKDFIKATVESAVKPIRIASESFEVVEIFDKPVLFTHERLRPMDIPEGLFKYDIRQDDNGQGNMSELKNNVGVNHLGSVICKEPFEITQEHDGILCTTQEGLYMTTDDYNYTGAKMTIEEYKNSYDELLLECKQGMEQTSDGMSGMSM